MKSLKKTILLGSLGICLLQSVPAQKAQADAGLTLGIIGTVLGGTALGTHVLDAIRGNNQPQQYPVYYSAPPIPQGGSYGYHAAPAAPVSYNAGYGGCCGAAPVAVASACSPCAAATAPVQPVVNYAPAPVNHCGAAVCNSPVYPKASVPVEQTVLPVPIIIAVPNNQLNGQLNPQIDSLTMNPPLPPAPYNPNIDQAKTVRGLW